ncbi:putative MFS monocarboxylate transporter [Talaromyces proteolyticus]|uniref:MFS monocarboxylate transporter n=1 Tax=Talaromyces proteolyticus TaxID=1131652 RepID=A0AAD4KDM5_9EURO|nr:putative MFS monocarboxylate transporter [Talaromyces proteolyticus]KAH8689314.1 putative MFS monocarboxylate transporter [Talaromyces proteolyticus]
MEKSSEKDLSKTLQTKPPDDVDIFPDGGLKAWTVVIGGWCLLFVSSGWINCIGVFQTYYEQNQLKNYSPSTTAWILSLETFMMFANGAAVGKFYDNFGPFYVMLFGSILHVFGVMMMSLSSEYYQFILAQGICSPLGASCLFYAAINAASTWFKKRRALALGIVVSGSSVGGVILPIFLQRLFAKVGFAWSVRAAGFLMLGLCVIAQVTVKSRLPPKPKPLNLVEFFRPLKEGPFLMITCGGFFFFWGMFVPFNYVIAEAQKIGMNAEVSSYLLAMLNGTSLFGRIFSGWLGDEFGRLNVTIFMSFLAGILTLALWLPAKGSAPIIAYAILYGFSSGAYISLVPAVIAQISPIQEIGVRSGSFFALTSLATLTGNPIAGAITTRQNGAFSGLQIFTGVILIVGSTFFLLGRVLIVGFKPQVV